MQEAFTSAWNEAAEILAVRGSYGTPLASKSAGSVRARVVGDDAEVEVDIPTGPDGDAVLRDIENTGAVVARPYLDSAESEGVVEATRAAGSGNVMVYGKIRVRSMVIGASDEVTNWPSPELVPHAGRTDARRPRSTSATRAYPLVASVALTPWPAKTATATLAAAIATLGRAIGEDDEDVTARLGATASALVEQYASAAPQGLRDECVVRVAGRIRESSPDSVRMETTGDISTSFSPSMTGMLLHSGCKSLLYAFRRKRAGVAK